MIYDREKIFELGKSFDSGLIRFEALNAQDKFALSKYYAIKNEELNQSINNTICEINNMSAHLDEIANSFNKWIKSLLCY